MRMSWSRHLQAEFVVLQHHRALRHVIESRVPCIGEPLPSEVNGEENCGLHKIAFAHPDLISTQRNKQDVIPVEFYIAMHSNTSTEKKRHSNTFDKYTVSVRDVSLQVKQRLKSKVKNLVFSYFPFSEPRSEYTALRRSQCIRST